MMPFPLVASHILGYCSLMKKTHTETIRRRLNAAGFDHVAGWLPSGEALRVKDKIKAHEPEVAKLKADSEQNETKT